MLHAIFLGIGHDDTQLGLGLMPDFRRWPNGAAARLSRFSA